MIGEEAKTFTLFVSLPEEESNPTIEPISLTLVGEAKNDSINGIYDELLIFFIVLIIRITNCLCPHQFGEEAL